MDELIKLLATLSYDDVLESSVNISYLERSFTVRLYSLDSEFERSFRLDSYAESSALAMTFHIKSWLCERG